MGLSVAVALLTVATVWQRSQTELPLRVSAELLGYTNRIGPFAVMAITNRSSSAVTLHTRSRIQYSLGLNPTNHLVTAVDGHNFKVTKLAANQGFVQEFFISPGRDFQWQLSFDAAYSSVGMEARALTEAWIRKHFPRLRFLLTSESWHKFETDWFPSEPTW
jgi:hypothetical protein